MRRESRRVGQRKRRKTPDKCGRVLVCSSGGRPLDILFNNINDWSKKAAAFFLQRRARLALFVEQHLAAASLPREKELWERHGYRLFIEPANQRTMARAPQGGTGAMCEKALMAGEFLPTELQQIFDEATMQAITIRLRGCTLLLLALYLQPNLGPVAENMRR